MIFPNGLIMLVSSSSW